MALLWTELSGAFNKVEPTTVLSRTGTLPTLFSGVMARTQDRLFAAKQAAEPKPMGGKALQTVLPAPDALARPMIVAALPAARASQEGSSAPAGAAAAAAVSSAPSTSVSITRARWPLWSRGNGNLATFLTSKGGLQDLSIPVGKYVFTFDAPTRPSSPYTGFQGNTPFEVAGKKCAVEKVLYRADKGEIQVQVRIDTNPVPVLLLIGGAASLLLLPMLNDSLKQIDRVIVDVSNVVLAGAIGLGVWWLAFRRRKAA